MKTIPSAIATHLAGKVHTLAQCWKVVRKDATVIYGTTHDRDITIASGTYAGTYHAQTGISGSTVASSGDLSVDNLEVQGSLEEIVSIVGLTAADIEAGQYDDAAVTLFVVNWTAPNDGQVVIRFGHIGNFTRTAEGHYTTELRGITQRLVQPIVRVYSETCDTDLGSARCGVTLATHTRSGSVASVTSRRAITATITAGSPALVVADFTGGLLTFTSGANSGYSREVKKGETITSVDHLEFYEPFPLDITAADTFTISRGCDKTFATCKAIFSNALNFQGYGLLTPGVNKMIAGPDRGSGPV